MFEFDYEHERDR